MPGMKNIFSRCLQYGDDIQEEANTTYEVQYDVSERDGGGEDDAFATQQLQGYTILSEADIRHRQEKLISRISTGLSLSRVSAITLLCNYNWSARNVLKAWFANEEEMRSSVGLFEKPTVQYPNFKLLTCLICLKRFFRIFMYASACGHPFCKSCWKGYIRTSINEGAGCLTLTCPYPSCNTALGQDRIYLFASGSQQDKYSRYILRSYVERNTNIKWCPAPGCDYAVEYNVVDSASFEVCCKCTYKFCWNCCVEIHHPVDCRTATNWIPETENTNWLLANTKLCPNCNCPIEKICGCRHMTCRPPCKYQFCWECLGKWSSGHVCEDGCLYKNKKKMSSNALERYTRYYCYNEWSSNENSRKKAIESLQRIPVTNIKSVSDLQIKVITDTLLQIIEGRRVLMWTYAYRYYIPEHEDWKKNVLEKLQDIVNTRLILLEMEAEKYFEFYQKEERTSQDLTGFFTKLVDQTVVARDFVETLVQALKSNFEFYQKEEERTSHDLTWFFTKLVLGILLLGILLRLSSKR